MRRTPYTERGIARVPCRRCGKPSRFQWTVEACANFNRREYVALCTGCDVALNAHTLRFLRIPDARAKIAAYRARVAA